ncbi:MAG: hypothetical protein PVF96_05680 [Candidatus Bathyarchaeota archaeon]
MDISGIQFKMRYNIIQKIQKAGGTSIDKAVLEDEIGLDMQERLWLPYFAGAALDIIKKTRDKRYYITR